MDFLYSDLKFLSFRFQGKEVCKANIPSFLGGGGELFDFLFLVFGETLKHSGQVPGFQSLPLTSSGTSSFLICKIGIIVILTF